MPYLSESEDTIAQKVLYTILNETEKSLDPLAMSAYIYGADWIIDMEFFQSIWRQLLEVGICPFLLHRASNQGATKLARIPGPHSLWRAIDFLVVLLKLAHCNGHNLVVDAVVLILADFSGSFKKPITESIISLLKLDTKLQGVPEAIAVPSRNQNSFLSTLLTSMSARAALCTLMQVVHLNPTYISQSWSVVWFTLTQLRDCSLLPLEMVSETDPDLLPSRARLDFELRLLKTVTSKKADTSKTKVKKASSLLSFGDFFFGSGQADEDASDRVAPSLVVNRADVKRWDSGYEEYDGLPSKSQETDNSSEDPEVAVKVAMKNLRCGSTNQFYFLTLFFPLFDVFI
jgi:hypothetical protein